MWAQHAHRCLLRFKCYGRTSTTERARPYLAREHQHPLAKNALGCQLSRFRCSQWRLGSTRSPALEMLREDIDD